MVVWMEEHFGVGVWDEQGRETADAVPGVEYAGTVERISDATGSAF